MFSERVKSLRKESGKTQKEVAKALGFSENAYGFYEQGRRSPDFDNLIKIADFFDVSLDYLLGRSEEKAMAEDIKKEVLENDQANLELFKLINENPKLYKLNRQLLEIKNSRIIEEIIEMNNYLFNILSKK